jgi:hypothetical protein
MASHARFFNGVCRLFCLALASCFFALSAESTTFTNADVAIEFAGPFEVRDQPGETLYPQYLAKSLQTVDFCKWSPQPPHVQQVSRPERGFLCELHVLPAQPEGQVLKIVEAAHQAESRKHVRNFRLETVTLGKHRVVRWRFQVGKTRLDHFILIGKRHNYLFVSSPYGSNGAIEEIIRNASFFPN